MQFIKICVYYSMLQYFNVKKMPLIICLNQPTVGTKNCRVIWPSHPVVDIRVVVLVYFSLSSFCPNGLSKLSRFSRCRQSVFYFSKKSNIRFCMQEKQSSKSILTGRLSSETWWLLFVNNKVIMRNFSISISLTAFCWICV